MKHTKDFKFKAREYYTANRKNIANIAGITTAGGLSTLAIIGATKTTSMVYAGSTGTASAIGSTVTMKVISAPIALKIFSGVVLVVGACAIGLLVHTLLTKK